MEIYLSLNDEETGPFSTDQINEKIRSGEATKTDMIWHEGLPQWFCLGLRPEFRELLAESEGAAKARSARDTETDDQVVQAEDTSMESWTSLAEAEAAAKKIADEEAKKKLSTREGPTESWTSLAELSAAEAAAKEKARDSVS